MRRLFRKLPVYLRKRKLSSAIRKTNPWWWGTIGYNTTVLPAVSHVAWSPQTRDLITPWEPQYAQLTGTSFGQTASTSNKPIYRDPAPLFGRAAARFETFSNGGRMYWKGVSTANAELNFLHNGAGCTVIVSFCASIILGMQTILGTCVQSSANRGAVLKVLNDGSLRLAICNADLVATPPIFLVTAAGVVTAGAKLWAAYTLDATEAKIYASGGVAVAAAPARALTASNAQGALTLGQQFDGAEDLVEGEIRDLLIYNRVLTEAEVRSIGARLSVLSGVAA